MISFSLSDEQKALRELGRQFAENEIAPVAAEYDREAKHPGEIIEKAHGLGLMNMTVPAIDYLTRPHIVGHARASKKDD